MVPERGRGWQVVSGVSRDAKASALPGSVEEPRAQPKASTATLEDQPPAGREPRSAAEGEHRDFEKPAY
ncbi:MAG: hypothetical protein ACI9U2_003374, partial [Bradymonadia bacterium]